MQIMLSSSDEPKARIVGTAPGVEVKWEAGERPDEEDVVTALRTAAGL
jgi:hypothetical protein